MKKASITIIILLITVLGYSQKIVEDKVDEFTKDKIIRTDWEKLSNKQNIYTNSRVSKINDTYYLELRVITTSVSSINTNDDISFMFDDGTIVNLHSTEYHITGYGDGAIGLIGSSALGFSIDCLLSTTDIEKFKSNSIVKFRINKSEGYSESEVSKKHSGIIKKMFQLIYL